MRLSPREQESLLTYQAGSLAQKRLARGLRLNYPEAVALIACQLQELVRDGTHAIAELVSLGSTLLGTAQVMSGVANMIHEVQVEATFPDGTKLISAHDPIRTLHGNLELALYGSFLPVPDVKVFERELLLDEAAGFTHKNTVTAPEQHRPGEIIPLNEPAGIELNAGRKISTLTVTSTCDRAIQVSSHFHFIEANPRLLFDRRKALGMRLNIPAGTAVRFEPGDRKTVQLVEIGGKRIVRGGNMLCNGEAKDERWNEILQRIQAGGFLHQEEPADAAQQTILPVVAKIPRALYAVHYGPTVGDRIRLGDTSLIIQIERDYAVYGDECTFGGGKTLREAMGQATGITNADGAPDTVIVNALIIDAQLGIVKADVGLRDGMICGIGKAGNPDCMDGVDTALIFGPGTEAISDDGLILTAGAIDSHIHFICPQICHEAIASGITTLIGGGTGPATGTCATTCTPGPNNIMMMLRATDDMPINFGFTGKVNTAQLGDEKELAAPLVEQIRAGACGLKLHEDWGTTPAAIDAGLAVGQAHDVQITIHTDTLNESANVEESIKAFAGRTIHAYHSEGAGGGHAPDIIRVCGEPNVIPSSTNPTRPLTQNTLDEHMDMLMVCHHLNRNLKEDLAFAESRIRAETMAARIYFTIRVHLA